MCHLFVTIGDGKIDRMNWREEHGVITWWTKQGRFLKNDNTNSTLIKIERLMKVRTIVFKWEIKQKLCEKGLTEDDSSY